MRGRKPIPTEVKKYMGNPGKHPLPKPGEEPEPKVFQRLPQAPDWLGEYGQREYKRVGPYLVKNKLLSEADWLPFLAYCMNVQMLIEASEDIKENGMTIYGTRGPVRNPALATFAAATTALRSLATEFGMTPSSRSRMKLPGDEEDSLEDILKDDEPEDAS
jgi:P27 family predicted phage terminase small subunit